MQRAVIVQLPFPSTASPDQRLVDYYLDYDRVFRRSFPEYFIPAGGLWEMPLWVAHLTALVEGAGLESCFCDISKLGALAEPCFELIRDATEPGDLVLMSPLAQNFTLALEVAGLLERAGRRVVLGGNMAPLVPKGSVHLVHRGQLDAVLASKLVRLTETGGGELSKPARPGKPISGSRGCRTTGIWTAITVRSRWCGSTPVTVACTSVRFAETPGAVSSHW